MSNLELYKSTEYQYQLSDEYLAEANEALLGYANTTSLSIKYWHIEIPLSKNINDINQQQRQDNYVWDIYHMVPTKDIQQLNYQIGYDPLLQGTSNMGTGSLTIFLVNEPLPGDLFTFYNSSEIFRVQEVRWNRSQSSQLKVYNLDFETAPMLQETVKTLRINENWYWNNESKKFIPSGLFDSFNTMTSTRKNIVQELNKFYIGRLAKYGTCIETEQIPLFLNSILYGLKKCFSDIRIKVQKQPLLLIELKAVVVFFEVQIPKDINITGEDIILEGDNLLLYNKTKELFFTCVDFIQEETFNSSFKKRTKPLSYFIPKIDNEELDTSNQITKTMIQDKPKPSGLLDIYLWMDTITGVHYSDSYENQQGIFDGKGN